MSKYLKRLVSFLLVFFTSFLLLTVLWGEFAPKYFKDNLYYEFESNSFLSNRLNESDTAKNVDIMVLGASQAYRGFDPRIFKKEGITIFNLGSSNQTQIQTEILVNKYIKQFNPKVVLYVVNHESFSMDGIESSIDLLSHGSIEPQSFCMAFRINSIRTYLTLIYATYRTLFNKDKNFQHPAKFKYDKYISGGFVEKEYHSFWSSKLEDHIKWDARGYQKKAFERTIKRIKETGAKIILIQAPHEKNIYKKIQNKEEYNDYYQSFNCDYFDYNKLLNLSKDYFFDSFHLNQQGVDTFNRDLIRRLKLQELIK